MKAFHNDPLIKQKYLERVRMHRAADNLIRGTGWDGHRGCAVGCTLEDYNHQKYETELGIPLWLAKVEDTLFEGMSHDNAMAWPERFLVSIKPGVELDKVKAPFMIFVLESTLKHFDHEKFTDVKVAVDRVIAMYRSGDYSHAADAGRAAYAAYAAADAADAAYAARAAAAADAAAAAAADAARKKA
jgi:hypothetical protein